MAEYESTKLHQALGTIAFFVIISMGILDGFAWYNPSYRVMGILGILFLVLIGFGALIETWLTSR